MSDPARDRRLAGEPRLRARRALSIESLVSDLRSSPEMRAMRRFAKVHDLLAGALPAHAAGRVRAVDLRAGVLTLEVADSVLLGELRHLGGQRILAAVAGAGANRLAWRLARRG